MKIAFVKQKYMAYGGGEAYLSGLLESCADKGHEIALIANEWNHPQKHSFTVHRAGFNKLTRGIRVKSFAASVARIVEREPFDVVFSLERTVSQQVWRAGDSVYPQWLRHRALYEPGADRAFRTFVSGQRTVLKLEEQCVRATPYLIANSKMIKDALNEEYPDLKSHIEIIYNGYDPDRFSIGNRAKDRANVRTEFGIAEDEKLILFVASSWHRKGLKELLQVLPRLSGAKLLVMGRDKTEHWKAAASDVGALNAVIFPGPTGKIERFYRAADVTILPSWYDSFGFVTLESIACGTPCVVSCFAGSHELIIPGINGTTVSRPDQLDELEEALKQALTIQGGNSVAATVAEYTLANNTEKTLEIIQKAAG